MLYPSDHCENGKMLRLIQQYFLVSAAMQNILNNYFKTHKDPKKIPELIGVHINDTHPVLCIPELMRLLMDKYGLGWEESWDIVKNTVSYTNHTILSEALEVKQLHAIEKVMPRIAMIIRELDRRFRLDLNEFFKNDFRRVESMAIISGNNVYMANLAIYASYAVNGVAKLHSQILKTRLFRDYAEMFPGKFKNVTNGVTHRRWIAQSNPELDGLICSLIGDKYYTEPQLLERLMAYEEDEKVLNKLAEIKFNNKKKFADFMLKKQGVVLDPKARFDVQVKRIHEYKRQLMNVLKIIYLCNKIKANPEEPVTPQVFIIAGKAASGYYMAKRIIKLINELAHEVNNDPVLASKIKVVFVENFNVSISELLMPATEVSEQISLAGREASGTGNMKAVMNGARMICTVDGANIEIADHCGHDTQFEFGLLADEVEKIKNRGYNAMDYYISSEKVRSVIDKLNAGVGNENFTDIADYLLGYSDKKDSYMCLADLDAYIDAHYKMDREYADKDWWNRKSLHCIASMGYFAADRSIEEYVSKIWKLTKNEE
jgi:starch phosphorylase